MEITQEYLKQIFDYKDGFLYWKIRPSIGVMIGNRAGCSQKFTGGNRYTIRINGKLYLNSRLIFLYHKGYLPRIVDHENHNTLDDKIGNLRDADYSKNGKNSTSRVNSTSKYLGVSFWKRDNCWKCQIKANGKQTHIGYFKDEKLAALAYNRMAVMYHREFANLNIISNF